MTLRPPMLPVTLAPVLDAPDLLRRSIDVPHGLTVAEIVDIVAHGMDRSSLRVWLVTRQGEWLVEPELWHRARPRIHARIIIRPVGKGDLRSILQILVTVVAAFVAGPLAGFLGPVLGVAAGTTAMKVLTAGIQLGLTFAGGLLINALLPNKAPDREKPLFQASAMRNPYSPNAPVPKLRGRLRYAPPYACTPYIEIVGDLQYLRAAFVLGYGPILIEEDEIKLGDTPISEYDEVEIELRQGYEDDEPLTLVNQQVVEEQVAVDLTRPLPRKDDGDPTGEPAEEKPETRWSAIDATGYRIIWFFPEGMIVINERGKEGATAVDIKIEIRPEGGDEEAWVEVDTVRISEKQKRPFFRQFDGIFPERGPRWEIRQTMMTPEVNELEDSSNWLRRTQWVALQSIRPEYPINMPFPVALAAVRIKATAQLQGQIDNFNLVASSVVDDFDPDEGDGEWVAQASDNPASLALDAIMGNTNPRPTGEEGIHWPDFEDWHQFCEDKGLTYNRLHDFRQRFGDTLAQIGAAGRGAVYHDGEKWRVIIDRPQEIPASLISARNAWDFRTRVEPFSPPDAWRVPFLDQSNGWNAGERIVPWPADVRYETKALMDADLDQDHGTRAEVYDDETPANNAYYRKDGAAGAGSWVLRPIVLTETAELPGKTDPAEVWRETRRQQYERMHRSMIHTAWQPGNARLATPGDLIVASRATMTRRTAEARVKRLYGDLVEIDDEFQFDEGIEYAIRWLDISADNIIGDMHVRLVTAEPGMRSAFTLVGPSDAPKPTPYIVDGQRRAPILHFGPAGSDSVDMILTRVQRGRDDTSMLEMRPAAAIIDTLTDAEVAPPWNGRVGLPSAPSTAIPAVPVVIRVLSGMAGTGTPGGVMVYLRPGSGSTAVVASYQVRHKLDGAGDWAGTESAPAASGAVSLPGYDPDDDVTFQCRALSTTAIPSAWGPEITFTVGASDAETPGTPEIDAGGNLGHAWIDVLVPSDDSAIAVEIFANAGGTLDPDADYIRAVAVTPGVPLAVSDGDTTRENVVVDGGFDNPGAWTIDGDITVTGSKAVKGATASTRNINQTIAALSGTGGAAWRWALQIDATNDSANMLARLYGGTLVSSSNLLGTGLKLGTLTAHESTTGFGVVANTSRTYTIDDLVLYRETPTCLPQGTRRYWVRGVNIDGTPGPVAGPVEVIII